MSATEGGFVGTLAPAGPVVLGADDPGDVGLEWLGEYEEEPAADSDLEHWVAIRTQPSRAVAAELKRRHSPEELLELAEDPCMWNLTCGAVAVGPAILATHRNDPPAPEEKPRAYIKAALRREAESVLKAAPADKPAAIRKARQSLDRLVMRGLSGQQLDAFLAQLEERAL